MLMGPDTFVPGAFGLMGMPKAPGSGTALVAHSPDDGTARTIAATSNRLSVLFARFMSSSFAPRQEPRGVYFSLIVCGSETRFQPPEMLNEHLPPFTL